MVIITKTIETLRKFKEISTSIATSQKTSEMYNQFTELRIELIKNKNLKSKLPDWAINSRDGSDFWEMIKEKFATYAERREFIRDSLNEAFIFLENPQDDNSFAIDQLLHPSMKIFNSEYIEELWQKAISRRNSDPLGTMTLARTLLETILKHILEELHIEYKNEKEIDPPKLYSLVSKALNLSCDQHTEVEFKKILNGLSKVVDGLTKIRGLASDAHGTGKIQYKLQERHSVFAINTAFTMIIFLADTFNEQKKKENFVIIIRVC